jgi:hypothetical protein
MIINCPICNKDRDSDFGKYICSDCKSKFEYFSDGRIKIIKRNKFDYWIFSISLIFPVFFGFLFIDNVARENFYLVKSILPGLIMIFYPLLITISSTLTSSTN